MADIIAVPRPERSHGELVSDGVRDRVMGCTDLSTLDRWIVCAATAASAEDALSDG